MPKFQINFLLLSILIHFVLFSGFFLADSSTPNKKNKKEIKELEIIEDKSKPPQQTIKISKQQQLMEKEPLPYQENILDKLLAVGKARPALDKIKPSESDDDLLISKVIEKGNVEKSSAYMNYYRLIREKIRKTAYQNYRGYDQGKVYLNFNIASDGSLQSIRFSEQSAENPDLKTVALGSIKQSAPFPSFPKELRKFSQLQFNISIYFKNN